MRFYLKKVIALSNFICFQKSPDNILVGVLLVFFVLGPVKSVFAYSAGDVIIHPWDGKYKLVTKAYVSTLTVCLDPLWYPHWEWNYMSYIGDSWTSSSCSPAGFLQGHEAFVYFESLNCQNEYSAKVEECGGLENVLSWDDILCTGECAPCVDEIAALEANCGSGNYFIELETCEGECIPALKNAGPPDRCEN